MKSISQGAHVGDATAAAHEPAPDRYERMRYRHCGRSGLVLPRVALGAWETYGGSQTSDVADACIRTAFDLGINHFDLANNYGHPPGNAETVCGAILRRLPRDEILISTKAGYPMWDGPTGLGGSRKHLLASCDRSLARLGLDYVDVFYHHCPDPDTPVEETIEALKSIVDAGKALYVGLSSYTGAQFDAAIAAADRAGIRITIHQPYYNLLGRAIESDLLPRVDGAGTGVIAFCPLASGLLTDKHLDGQVTPGSREAIWPGRWVRAREVDERRRILRGLDAIAGRRGQSLAQMAIAWILRDDRITAVVAGVTRPE
jgi:L-glyceraldehyde 3-phosphate reductase